MKRLVTKGVLVAGALLISGCDSLEYEPPYVPTMSAPASAPTPAPERDRFARLELRDVEVGPILNGEHARSVCTAAAARERGEWTGQWDTKVPNQMSVCQVAVKPGTPISTPPTNVAAPEAPVAITSPATLFFAEGSVTLSPEAQQALLALAASLRDNPRPVRIEGHTRSAGSRESNMALGERRGIAVRDFLTGNGVRTGTLEILSYGEESPSNPGDSPEAHAQNDRVVILF